MFHIAPFFPIRKLCSFEAKNGWVLLFFAVAVYEREGVIRRVGILDFTVKCIVSNLGK
jgi:hypothetical protein